MVGLGLVLELAHEESVNNGATASSLILFECLRLFKDFIVMRPFWSPQNVDL